MFYQELFPTEVLKESLKAFIKKRAKKREELNNMLEEFEVDYLLPIEKQIDSLSTDSTEFEHQFLRIKQNLLERQAWLDIFYEATSESVPSFSHISPLEMRRKKALSHTLDLIDKLLVFEPAILTLRHERIFKNFDNQVEKSLQKVESFLTDFLDQITDPKKKETFKVFLKEHSIFFKKFARFFHERIEGWEKIIIRTVKSILFSDLDQFPFTFIYTVDGSLYINLEIVGHLIGKGSGKVGYRTVRLHTADVFILLKPHSELENAQNSEKNKRVKERNFWHAWKESEILKALENKQGILPLRERFAFDLKKEKELYLIEEYFLDGSLEHYLKKSWKKKEFLTLDKKITIALQILIGLMHIHAAGYIHSDIKPGNILIDLRYKDLPLAVICDFNESFALSERPPHLAHSAAWAAPEIAKLELSPSYFLADQALFKGDVWGMGATLYVLFFDELPPWLPLKKEEIYKTIAELKKGWIPSRFKERPFFSLIEKMLEPDLNARPSAAEALERFAEAAEKMKKN